jgi:hypothetical protein
VLKVFYIISLAIFVFISLIFRDLNQQEVLINYFFSEVLVETAWLVIASFPFWTSSVCNLYRHGDFKNQAQTKIADSK